LVAEEEAGRIMAALRMMVRKEEAELAAAVASVRVQWRGVRALKTQDRVEVEARIQLIAETEVVVSASSRL
jgi:hypothetical protein